MRKAHVFQCGVPAGVLEELGGSAWRFRYHEGYAEEPVSFTMPLSARTYDFGRFPPPFEGLLPEGVQLEALLRRYKFDRSDLFGQLMLVGEDVVGSLTFRELP